jgi:hypothetical protein
VEWGWEMNRAAQGYIGLVGFLDGRPAKVEGAGRRRVAVGWAGYTIFRFLDDDSAVTITATQAAKRFRANAG